MDEIGENLTNLNAMLDAIKTNTILRSWLSEVVSKVCICTLWNLTGTNIVNGSRNERIFKLVCPFTKVAFCVPVLNFIWPICSVYERHQIHQSNRIYSSSMDPALPPLRS
jgi:hypothetical protein